MTSIRKFRIISRLFFFYLTDCFKFTDICKCCRNTKFRRRCTYTPRNHKKHMLIFSFVFPVYCSDQFRHVWLSDIRHIIVCNRINQNNVIDFHISGQSHRRMHILQNYFFFCNILQNLCFSDILKHLQWPALQQVYGIFSCF